MTPVPVRREPLVLLVLNEFTEWWAAIATGSCRS